MRQVELQGPKDIKITEAAEPKPGVGEVLVEVKATALCGTDVHIYSGDTPVAYPRVPGHEATGVVREIGEGVNALALGDHVVFNPNLNCWSCERCILGKENLCQSIQLLGREVDGTMSQFLIMPDTHSFRIPNDMPFGLGALIQPLSTAVHAQLLVDIQPSESAVVLGLGGTGLIHVRLSKLAGAYPVIAVGRSPWKLKLVDKFGADIIISARN
ncbi:MAG: alcohol dehydrogenase catalytic domain-containing protein [Chloroflexi bacterium]|nr:alcohol dehydrogenase catalytic domain-containing protein [Chloroflexota bacterium]MDA1226634.1 alcohol dehydrogenase catalytic domain-containing protein [Chloroflexota bacterium]